MKALQHRQHQQRSLPLYPTWFRWKTYKLKKKQYRIFQTLYPTWFRWKPKAALTLKQQLLPLYPTWFRWKESRDSARLAQLYGFISHMVQMKAARHHWYAACADLYIPHGSDESWYCDFVSCLKFVLYIPHGSDERWEDWEDWEDRGTFISHMVQMKERWDCAFQKIWRGFISHMVQMKDIDPSLNTDSAYIFISHMVQMKGRYWSNA